MKLKKMLIVGSLTLTFCGMPNLIYAQPAQLTIAEQYPACSYA
jgi:hypothetical protein